MNKIYVPILRVMPAELKALSHVTKAHRDKLIPLFEIPRLGVQAAAKKCYRGCENIKATYLTDKAEEIANVWKGRRALVDAYHWSPEEQTEYGEHVVPFLYSVLEQLGVRVVPVIGYDRWESQTYRLAMQSIDYSIPGEACLRLDSSAIDDAAEPDFLEENVEAILSGISLPASQISVLIDFGDIAGAPVEELIGKASDVLEVIQRFGFASYAVAGCSLPATINLAVKKIDSVGTVVRREMLLWEALREAQPQLRLMFGDYAVRGPKSNEGIPNPHTNGKIRYTTDRAFYVARGHSMQSPGKGAQMWDLARRIIASPHFMGEHFSWGDSQIVLCSMGGIKGTAGTWISIDTSHHLAFVLAEVQEVIAAGIRASVDHE